MQALIDQFGLTDYSIEFPDKKNRIAILVSMQVLPASFVDGAGLTWLHPDEWTRYQTIRSVQRRQTFATGRLLAKIAAAQLAGSQSYASIGVQTGVFGQPVIQGPHPSAIGVGLSHTDSRVAVVAYQELFPMAVDLEAVNPQKNSVIERVLTAYEMHLLTDLPNYAPFLLWTAKEALAKFLKTGINSPASSLYAVSDALPINGGTEIHYQLFPQLKAICRVANQHVYTLLVPRVIPTENVGFRF